MTAVVLPLRDSPRQAIAPVSESFWKSLSYFNLSRLILAAVLLATIILYRDSRVFGTTDPALFFRVCIIYFFLALVYWWALKRIRTMFDAHLAVHAVTDLVVITLLLHASGGIRSGLGILLLMPLAAAATVSGGRMALFFAALATFALFVENTYWVLHYEVGLTDYFPVGLLAAGCFTVALITNRLAKRLIANEALVRQRSTDLRNQLEINRLVIRDMPGGVLVIDPEGTVRLANPEAERLLGRGGVQGMPLDALAPALDAAGRRWRDARGQARSQVELNGRGVQVRLLNPSGGTQGELLMFLEDSSKLKVQAQQVKLAALGRLTANIAHEIRNPLSAIGHAAELLAEEAQAGAGQSAGTARLTRIIGDNTARLDRIVQEVLQLNRRDRESPEEIGLVGFLQVFIEQICQAEKIPVSAFELHLPPAAVVWFDRQHLHRVLWNLVVNAWRHSRQLERSIRIDVGYAPDQLVELHVIDDGEGVADEQAGQLFEPFFTTDARGTGLGLYIARELAEANRASLDFVSLAERDVELRARAGTGGADFKLVMEGYG